MEFNAVIDRRRTTRQFTAEPVAKEIIERILDAGIKAPSFDHMRKWNFIVVTDAAVKADILATTNEGLAYTMRIPTGKQPQEILSAVNCPEGFILPCMIGIGHAADNAEYPAQIYPKLSECVHWNSF